MFEKISRFLQDITNDGADESARPNDARVAVVALCYQVMEADGVVSESEQKRLRELMESQYGLHGAGLEDLITAGEEAGSEAVDFYRFTSDVKRHLDEDQRIRLIGLLWDIAYADGNRTEMEDNVVWRIAELVGVSGRDRVLERRAALKRAKIADEKDSESDE
ncbi:TerB family tellurite resistance protein [Martelella lutilitoris]|uniref:TerB family tellurite resistance protein n=1 Tax=Martelella lutilitoris TaxID=2583532 RepID=A0A7T7KM80_9HYPH|nr:TerB family tellurite resistance protein [Martelella lutilitoris]QQM31547.1 TerB family tellurite resistance protein [Martelella lutilitoris]